MTQGFLDFFMWGPKWTKWQVQFVCDWSRGGASTRQLIFVRQDSNWTNITSPTFRQDCGWGWGEGQANNRAPAEKVIMEGCLFPVFWVNESQPAFLETSILVLSERYLCGKLVLFALDLSVLLTLTLETGSPLDVTFFPTGFLCAIQVLCCSPRVSIVPEPVSWPG